MEYVINETNNILTAIIENFEIGDTDKENALLELQIMVEAINEVKQYILSKNKNGPDIMSGF